MTRKELVEKMAETTYCKRFIGNPVSWISAVPIIKDVYRIEAMDMLQVVLNAIEDGEIVELQPACNDLSRFGEMEIALKPEFRSDAK